MKFSVHKTQVFAEITKFFVSVKIPSTIEVLIKGENFSICSKCLEDAISNLAQKCSQNSPKITPHQFKCEAPPDPGNTKKPPDSSPQEEQKTEKVVTSDLDQRLEKTEKENGDCSEKNVSIPKLKTPNSEELSQDFKNLEMRDMSTPFIHQDPQLSQDSKLKSDLKNACKDFSYGIIIGLLVFI